jgi:MFS family permease
VVLLSALLVQAAWILAVPAFGGIDEFDHVYRAEAVAHGQLFDEGGSEAGRGGLVTVPDDIVTAASATCSSYDYTGPANCHPVEHVGDGMVTVASGAATYNPAYYAVVGLMARPFSGAAADYALRVYTAVLAALLLAWAAALTSGWARNAWPLVGLLVASTPMLVYSAAIASPNALGYAAASLLWAAGLGLVEDPGRPKFVALTTAAVTMVVTHSTGVMWLGFVLATIALLQPLGRWRSVWQSSRPAIVRSTACIGMAVGASVAWILVAKTNALNPPTGALDALKLTDVVKYTVLWALQTIGAFPLRYDHAPPLVYALWLVPFVALMWAGYRRASTRVRGTIAVLMAVWLIVPWILSVIAYPSEGMAWQGRYALPLALGFPALAGLALSRTGRTPRSREVFVAFALTGLAHSVSAVWVGAQRIDIHLAPELAANLPVGLAMVSVLAAAGGLLPLVLARAQPDRQVAGEPVHLMSGEYRS